MLFKILLRWVAKETQSVSLQIIQLQIATICTLLLGNQYDILGAQNLQLHNLYLSVHLFLGNGSPMVVEASDGGRDQARLFLKPSYWLSSCRHHAAKPTNLQNKLHYN